MPLKAEKVEKWVWKLIYGGLLAAGLGVSLRESVAPLGWTLVGAGVVAAVAGVVLIFVRARIGPP